MAIRMSSIWVLAAVVVCSASQAHAQCLANTEVNDFFAGLAGGAIPQEGSCCQFDVCGIPCPAPVPKAQKGFGIAVGVAIALFCAIGFGCYFLVKGDSSNFFVAGRTLPLFVCSLTLASQSLDSNALLGNADLAYKYVRYPTYSCPIHFIHASRFTSTKHPFSPKHVPSSRSNVSTSLMADHEHLGIR